MDIDIIILKALVDRGGKDLINKIFGRIKLENKELSDLSLDFYVRIIDELHNQGYIKANFVNRDIPEVFGNYSNIGDMEITEAGRQQIR